MNEKDLTPEEYLEKYKVKEILINIVKSLIEKRPSNIEKHIVTLLTTQIPFQQQPITKTEQPLEQFPSFQGKQEIPKINTVSNPINQTSARRKSAISAQVLTTFNRRGAMSSKITSNTQIDIPVFEKDEETTLKLLETIKSIPIFSHLESTQQNTLVKAFSKIEFNNESIIIKQGDQPDYLYIIDSGKVNIFKNINGENIQVSTLFSGQYFGELAIISGTVRAATVIADGPVKLWALDQKSYIGVARNYQHEKRQRYKDILRSIPFLSSIVDDYNILLIVDALKKINTLPNEIIIKQNDIGDLFYIILSGECIVKKKDENNNEIEVGKLKEGQYFGELALIYDKPRAASIISLTQCELVALDKNQFARLLEPCMNSFKKNFPKYGGNCLINN